MLIGSQTCAKTGRRGCPTGRALTLLVVNLVLTREPPLCDTAACWIGLVPNFGSTAHDLFGDRLSRGGRTRGVPDNRVFGQSLLGINTQISTVIVDWRRVTDIQLVPFVDTVVVRKAGWALNWDDAFVGFGADLLVFSGFLRGFEARLSFGIDARAAARDEESLTFFDFFVTELLQF